MKRVSKLAMILLSVLGIAVFAADTPNKILSLN